MEEYISVSKSSVTEITEKKSKFIAHIAHAKTESEAYDFINSVKKKHYNATHNVFAYILKSGEKKYSDDGEPSKTAGFPILDMLEKENITDVVCVVTRYFGGTLLGVGGLIRAYTRAAKEGLENSGVSKQSLCSVLEITSDYTFLEKIKHILKSQTAVIENIEYLEKAIIYVIVPVDFTEKTIDALKCELGINAEFEIKKEIYYSI